jgi:hypothetical protein
MRKFIASLSCFILPLCVASLMCSGCLVSQTAARETAALRELLAIYKAEETYHFKKNWYGRLVELAEDKLINDDIAKGKRGGYKFELELRDTGFDAYATPQKYPAWFENSAKRSFYINEKEILTHRDKQGRKADANDERVEQ